jgi:hypothetical protein
MSRTVAEGNRLLIPCYVFAFFSFAAAIPASLKPTTNERRIQPVGLVSAGL